MTDLTAIDFHHADCSQQFVASLRDIGFAVLENHPLNMTLVNTIYTQWREFFSTSRKYEFELNKDTQDGYFSFQQAESAKGIVLKDFKEYFHYYGWGQCPAELKDNLQAYYEAANEFAVTLLGWIENGSPVDVAKGYREPLSSMITDSDSTLLRVLHYPPMDATHQETTWAAAHEDINLITILPASDAPGLQVQKKNGEWIDVASNGNQVIVNIGDMLQEASGGYFPSTSHRVVTPANTDNQSGRMSLPLFLHPRPEVILSGEYTAGSYLYERLKELGVI
ncbi:MAG: isopenicillin N synthase-like dioxygenase [Candidatus Azotimanducaceae bacterium]|jgi:isopenicillin N synthase-like dioxygenase